MSTSPVTAPAAPAAPAYLPRDTYTGRHTHLGPKAPYRADTYTAAELAALAPTGVIWESFGHPYPGVEGFGRSRYVADSDGRLHVYNSEGGKVLVHPADRALRILTR